MVVCSHGVVVVVVVVVKVVLVVFVLTKGAVAKTPMMHVLVMM